jgi:hypothetical protein
VSVDLDALFGTFRHTAFRLETRQVYHVVEEWDSFTAWRDGRVRPERSVRTDSYLRHVARAALAGKRWNRVRLVEYPLTEYTRYELACYPENQAAGERVHILDDTLVSYGDFWLFDRGHATAQGVFMRYTSDGQFGGLEAVTERAVLRGLEMTAANLLDRATPLDEFLTRHSGG